jgi:hypothetical protein
MEKENPAPLAGGNRAGVLQAERAVDTRDILKRQARQVRRLGAAGIIVTLMREVEHLRAEVEALREENHALRAEIYLRDDCDAALLRIPGPGNDAARTMIARTARRLAEQRRPSHEIKAAVLAEAERVDYPSKAAIQLAGAILDEWAADHG